MTRQRVTKIVGWTFGMAFAVLVMLSKGFISPREHVQHALIGAAIGLVLGFVFAARLPNRSG